MPWFTVNFISVIICRGWLCMFWNFLCVFCVAIFCAFRIQKIIVSFLFRGLLRSFSNVHANDVWFLLFCLFFFLLDWAVLVVFFSFLIYCCFCLVISYWCAWKWLVLFLLFLFFTLVPELINCSDLASNPHSYFFFYFSSLFLWASFIGFANRFFLAIRFFLYRHMISIFSLIGFLNSLYL